MFFWNSCIGAKGEKVGLGKLGQDRKEQTLLVFQLLMCLAAELLYWRLSGHPETMGILFSNIAVFWYFHSWAICSHIFATIWTSILKKIMIYSMPYVTNITVSIVIAKYIIFTFACNLFFMEAKQESLSPPAIPEKRSQHLTMQPASRAFILLVYTTVITVSIGASDWTGNAPTSGSGGHRTIQKQWQQWSFPMQTLQCRVYAEGERCMVRSRQTWDNKVTSKGIRLS